MPIAHASGGACGVQSRWLSGQRAEREGACSRPLWGKTNPLQILAMEWAGDRAEQKVVGTVNREPLTRKLRLYMAIIESTTTTSEASKTLETIKQLQAERTLRKQQAVELQTKRAASIEAEDAATLSLVTGEQEINAARQQIIGQQIEAEVQKLPTLASQLVGEITTVANDAGNAAADALVKRSKTSPVEIDLDVKRRLLELLRPLLLTHTGIVIIPHFAGSSSGITGVEITGTTEAVDILAAARRASIIAAPGAITAAEGVPVNQLSELVAIAQTVAAE
jgi:hypothetical protein